MWGGVGLKVTVGEEGGHRVRRLKRGVKTHRE